MLLINKTVIPIVTGNALGFFTGSGNVIAFSVDLSDFCRSFRVESNTTERSTENAITFPDLVKNPSAFPVTIGITVLLMSSITLISFWTRTIYGTWFQQLLCHSVTLLIDTLCPISTLNQQLTNLEHTHIRCSLPCEGWTIKGRDCASALHSFNEIT